MGDNNGTAHAGASSASPSDAGLSLYGVFIFLTGVALVLPLATWLSGGIPAIIQKAAESLPSRAAPLFPESGDWLALTDAQREAIARSFGYGGELREGRFMRFLDAQPDRRAEFFRRYLPNGLPGAPAAVPIPESGDWLALTEAQREAIARSFGYDGELREGRFMRFLDTQPDRRAEFFRRYLPNGLPGAPAAPPESGNWLALTEAQREAIARSFGYDGELREGKFMRFLDAQPDRRAEFFRRYLPDGLPGSVAAAPVPPPLPPPLPDWRTASVKPPAPAPAPPSMPARPAVQAPSTDGGAKFAVQAGSFRDAANADAMVRRLTARGYPAYAVDWTDRQKIGWHIVRVGSFKTAADARKVAGELVAIGVPGQVLSIR